MTSAQDRFTTPHPNDTPTDQRDPRAAATLAIEPGATVPITVWRLDDRDDGASATTPGEGLLSRLAQRLILTYTRQGETVVDFDANRHLRDAATAAARTYLAITDPAELADLDAITDPVTLVIFSWPRPTATANATPDSVADLFTASRLLINTDTGAIAAISYTQPDQPSPANTQHLAELLPAAQAANLTHILRIIAVTGSGNGDQFLYYATSTEAETARNNSLDVAGRPTYHADLLVFAAGPRRHD